MLKSCLFAAVAVFGLAFVAPAPAEARVVVGPRGGVAVSASRPYYGGLAYRTAVYPAYTTSYVYPTSAYLYSTTSPYPVYTSQSVLIGPAYGRYRVMSWR